MKKTIALILSLVMILSMGVSAFAENSDGESYTRGSITIKNPIEGETYKAYKIFDVTYDGAKYAYTIAPEWVDDVIAYTEAAADTNGIYTGKGMIITPVKDTKGSITCYNVTLVQDDPDTPEDEATFSAADFGEQMAAKTTGKTAIVLKADETSGEMMAKDLDLGYYMVQPTAANSLVSLTTTDKDVVIYDKNEQPVPDKKIVGEDPILICTKLDSGSDDYDPEHKHGDECYKEKEYTTKSVGDKVDFEVDTKVPDMTGYKTYFFVLNDTMTAGLTFNDDVVVTLDGETLGTDAYTVKTTENADGSTNIRIVFNDMKQYWSDDDADKAGAPIVVTYSATVDEDAVMGTVGNTNTVYIEYSNNPNIVPEFDPEDPPKDEYDPKDPKYKHNDPDYDGKDPTGESVNDEVVVFTAELSITKIDASNTQKTLTGAKFRIEGEKLNVSIVNKTIFEESADGTWYRLKDGTYTETAPANINKDPADPLETYEMIAADFERFSYEEGEETEAIIGMFYKDGDDYIEITESNKDQAIAPFYDKIINIVGLYYTNDDGATYTAVTEADAASHLNDTLYKKTIYKQSDLYEDTKTKYKKVEVITKENAAPDKYTAEGFVDENGVITFGGLAEGEYYITELIAPDGYNLLKSPVKVVVELVPVDETTNSYKFQATIDDAEQAISEADGHISFDIQNSQGIELPETGGIGTVLFIAIGAVMFMAAGIVLTAKKRLYNEG